MKKSLILAVAAALSFPVFGGDFSWNGFRYDAEKVALKNAENNNFGMLQIFPESKKELVKIRLKRKKWEEIHKMFINIWYAIKDSDSLL